MPKSSSRIGPLFDTLFRTKLSSGFAVRIGRSNILQRANCARLLNIAPELRRNALELHVKHVLSKLAKPLVFQYSSHRSVYQTTMFQTSGALIQTPKSRVIIVSKPTERAPFFGNSHVEHKLVQPLLRNAERVPRDRQITHPV